MNPTFAFFEGAFAPSHILVVLIVGAIVFGNRLPEVGRMLGKGLMEFKRGLAGLEDELKVTGSPQQRQASQPPQFTMPQVPQRVVQPTQVTASSSDVR
jgi:TatA/E family protein of Tat protein translocase